MEAGEQQVWLEIKFSQMVLGRMAQRLDIGSLSIIRRQGADRGLRAQLGKRSVTGIECGSSRCRAILGIKWRQQYPVTSSGDHAVQPVRYGRRAITHRPIHFDLRSRQLLQLGGGFKGVNRERRTFTEPDFAVGLRGFGWPSEQDGSAQNGLPQQLWYLHDPFVRQKLTQIASYGSSVRSIWRAQVDQKNPDICHI